VTRIIAGVAGGRRIQTPAGQGTRPTSDRVREALFSALESELGGLSGLSVLDLYAGSGALGLEARSRGADSVTMVEQSRAAIDVISRNVRDLGLDGVLICRADVVRWTAVLGAGPPYDLVLADPPYATVFDDVAAVLSELLRHGRLSLTSLVVVERSTREPAPGWPDGFTGLRQRRYGETTLWYGRLSP